jgi:hypothetical protein
MIVPLELDRMPEKPGRNGWYRTGDYFLLKRKRKFGVLCQDGRMITNISLLKRDAIALINRFS